MAHLGHAEQARQMVAQALAILETEWDAKHRHTRNARAIQEAISALP